MADKKEIINLLEEIADLLEFKGENKFKVSAFRNCANIIRRLDTPFEKIVKDKSLGSIKGIGKGLQNVIYEFFETGRSKVLEELKSEVPAGINELLKIRGLGPKKLNVLHNELGITSLGELEYACAENRLALLKGFGETSQQKIVSEIDKIRQYNKFLLIDKAEEIADGLLAKFNSFKSIKEVAISGEMRRGMEIISGIIFIVLITDKEKFIDEIKSSFGVKEENGKIIIEDDSKVSIIIFYSFTEDEFSRLLFITTGSEEFISHSNLAGKELLGKSEKELFENAALRFVIPEMREAQYWEQLNPALIKNSDLSIGNFKGLLHFHTTYSDGRNTLREMLVAAENTGFEFAAVCDHSKSAVYANGLTEERILKQKEEIKEISSSYKLHIFQGIESDILNDGSLDYSSEFLEQFDFIVASIHSRFNLEKDKMTARLIKAIENPFTDLLGHPSGRLLLSRDPYEFDAKKIIDACAANKVAIEINANPHRLDLDWRWIYYARDKGCLFSINPDAHSVDDISYIKYGILTGRKGGLQHNEVINCYELNDFKLFLKRKINRKLS